MVWLGASTTKNSTTLTPRRERLKSTILTLPAAPYVRVKSFVWHRLKFAFLANLQIVFSLKKHNITGALDGMTIDTDGNLWIAIFNGFRVIKIDPRRPETLLDTIPIPSKQVPGGIEMTIVNVFS
jgi:hypothetical protein